MHLSFNDYIIARAPNPRASTQRMISHVPIIMAMALQILEREAVDSGKLISGRGATTKAEAKLLGTFISAPPGDLYRQVCVPALNDYCAARIAEKNGNANQLFWSSYGAGQEAYHARFVKAFAAAAFAEVEVQRFAAEFATPVQLRGQLRSAVDSIIAMREISDKHETLARTIEVGLTYFSVDPS